jgi:hypothetical protein
MNIKNIFLTLIVFSVAELSLGSESFLLNDDPRYSKTIDDAGSVISARMKIANNLAKNRPKEEILKARDQVKKRNVWDKEQKKGGIMYFLEAPYGDMKKGEYLSIAVGQAFRKDRPAVISFTLPNTVDTDKGFYITFCNTEYTDTGTKSACSDSDSYLLSYSNCDDAREVCKVVLRQMYINSKNNNRKVDLFKLLASYDDIGFSFYDKGNIKSLNVSFSEFLTTFNKVNELIK